MEKAAASISKPEGMQADTTMAIYNPERPGVAPLHTGDFILEAWFCQRRGLR